MLSALLIFELRYHFRQATFRIAVLLFLCLGLSGVHGNFGGSEVHKNAPYVITYIISILSLFSIFAATLCCANVVLRDTTHKTDALLFTTAIKRFPYFTIRFLGLLLALFTMLSAAIVGMLAGSLLADSAHLGRFNPVHFIQPFLVFGIPDILFVCSIIFSTAVLTRDVRATYASGVLLYILYTISAILGNSPLFAGSALKEGTAGLFPLLSDPFALSIFFGDTRSWSILQRNELLFPLGSTLLLNRLLWTVCSGLLLMLSYRYFAFRLQLPAQNTKSQTEDNKAPAMPYYPKRVRPQSILYKWNSFRSQFSIEAISVFKHIPFLLMLAMWIFMFSLELKDSLMNGVYQMRFYPATNIIIESLLPVKPAMLLLIFYTAELSARERSTNIQALLYSTPVPNTVIWAAKFGTLALLIATLITANIAIGMVMQISKGFREIDLLQYASLYYYSGFPLLLFAALTLFIQTLTPDKYPGMLLNLFAAAVVLFGHQFGITHYMLRYAQTPRMDVSAMSGFGHYADAFNWYMIYWSALAAIFAILTINLWQRSRYLKRQLTFKPALLIPLLIFAATGTYIYYKTNSEGGYQNKNAQLDWRARYEQQYRPMAYLPQPVITSVKTNVDIYPAERKYTVKGTYQLKNTSLVPISKIWISVHPEVTSCSIQLPGVAHESHDNTFNQHWYTLQTPLLPGATTSLQFSMQIIRSGFTPFNNENNVAANGSYIELEKYVPAPGYNNSFEIEDRSSRKERGLTEVAPLLSADSTYHLIDFETTISTAQGQYVVTSGTLQRSWSANDRSYFHYKTAAPIRYMFALSAAAYEVKKETYKGIEFSIRFHPGQTTNLHIIMQAMKDAIDYCTKHFGPYPYKQLALAEVPQYKGAATAYPGVVFSAENINFQGDFNDTSQINYLYGITVHEVAHQWWANKLSPVYRPGAAMLTETLAQYTEAMVLEHTFGKMMMRNYLQAENRLYFSLHDADEQELPLAATNGQAFVHYQKGSLAMYALKETLGEERLNNALHRLIDKHAYPALRATTDDLLEELRTNASASEAKHITDWLEQVIVYSLKMEVVSCKQLPDKRYQLQLNVTVEKKDQSNDHSLPPDEDIDVAIFDVSPGELNSHSKPLYLQKQHFSQKSTKVTLIVNKAPKTALIDLFSYFPDTDQSDNVAGIE